MTQIFSNNEVFHCCSTHYLSYLAEPSELTQAIDTAIREAEKKDTGVVGTNETAICIRDDSKEFGIRFLILYGDHRKAMEPIKNDLAALTKYWKDLPVFHGHTSDNLETPIVQGDTKIEYKYVPEKVAEEMVRNLTPNQKIQIIKDEPGTKEIVCSSCAA